ncbi:hypothetical protein A0H81_08440 [Grifola frondosa]|uniref:Uncharacterized protein n=1 Tax=Grifola frondosa TaxID=5627 RepID=A0A1C7M403_GRIFR|nr:hypothetical protein A0H81_08440 [Grifola frondosa]
MSSSVSYTAINVRCAPLSTQQIGYNTTANAWVISSQIRNDIITPFGPNTVRIPPIRQNSVSPDDDPWNFPGILIYASLNITDSRGVNGTTIRLDPPITPFMASNYSYTDIQVITCNIRTNASDDPHIFIDTHTQLVDYSETEKHSFTTLPPSGVWLTTPDTSPRNNTLEADWAAIFNVLTVPSQLQVTDQCLRADDVDDNCQVYSTLTTVEKYINDRLGLEPPSAYDLWSASKNPNGTISRRSVSLSDLEQALGNATAAIYWASDTGPKRRKIILATVKRKVGAQVTLHPIPLIVGLVASITLLCLAIHIGWEPHSEIEHTVNPDLEGLGLLQLVWLLAQHSYVQDELMQVKTPSTKELRRASRFQVHFDMLRTAPRTGLRELTDDKELQVAVQEHTVT